GCDRNAAQERGSIGRERAELALKKKHLRRTARVWPGSRGCGLGRQLVFPGRAQRSRFVGGKCGAVNRIQLENSPGGKRAGFSRSGSRRAVRSANGRRGALA